MSILNFSTQGRNKSLPAENNTLTTEAPILSIIRSTVYETLRQANLDNLTPDTTDMTREDNVMPILRQRVIVGYNDDESPIYKKVQAGSVDKLNDRIVQAYVESGRIWEFIEPDGRPKKKEKTLFKVYVEKWLTVYKQPVLKPRTYQTYYGYLRSHLLPAFGDMYIEDITTDDVQRFLNDRKEQTRKSLKNYLALLKQILEAAKEDKIIDECPTESKRLSTHPTRRNRVKRWRKRNTGVS